MDQRYIERLDYNASETLVKIKACGQFCRLFSLGPDLKRNPMIRTPNLLVCRSAWLEKEFIAVLFVDHCRQILLLDRKIDQQIAN